MRYKDAGEFMGENGYAVEGTWYPRVTRILAIKSKPALDVFFREMGSFESAEVVKQKSAEEGTLVHETVGRLALGEVVDIPESIRPAAEAFLEFQKTNDINFHPDFIERLVWSGQHRYAGTIDALASVDGKFGVLDIKTSTGFYPEYNLQTIAYLSALREPGVARALALPQEAQTRWILRIDQKQTCKNCTSTLRTKGGREKIRSARSKSLECEKESHEWGDMKGEVEIREFPYYNQDMRAFLAAKTLWEWEYRYWLRQVGYAQ